MKSKPVNLSVWMFLKAVPAALLLLYYWMCTVEGYDPVFRYLHASTLVLAGALVWAQVSYARKRKIFDEFARENLKTTDSICLKVAYVGSHRIGNYLLSCGAEWSYWLFHCAG